MAWNEADPALSSAIAIDDLGNYVTQLLLFTIIAFGIMNTVLMSVLHRHREFGVLQALGLTPGQTGAIVLIEGLALTAISGCIGVAFGLLGTWYVVGDGLDISSMTGDMTFAGVAPRSGHPPGVPGRSGFFRRWPSSRSSAPWRPSTRRSGRPGST